MTNNLISRQAAIDALDGEIEITGRTNAEAVKGYVRLVRDRLERLPSAQPDTRSLEQIKWERDIAIQQLKDLGYSLGEKVRTDGDTISRRVAISLPVKPKEDRYFQTQNLDDAYDYGWYSLQECIEKLPSVQSAEAIPVAFLEEQAKWFESIDNTFAKIEANNIRVMIKKWRSKKDER